jgi:CHASE3 domain sensor protein
MRDAAHPDNPRYEQALGKLNEMESQRAQAGLQPIFAQQDQTERAAAQLVVASKMAGMNSIDTVVARLDGSGVFAVQGQANDPASQRTLVHYSSAIAHSVEDSSRQSEQAAAQQPHDQQRQQEQEQLRARAL